MSQAKQGDTVKIHYKGTLNDGSVFDSSEGREPLEFTLGSGMVIPGFDKGVEGMKVDEEKDINIPVAEAYGEKRDDLVFEVDRQQVPAEITPEIGQTLYLQQPDGTPMPVQIAAVNEAKVTLDANHPLAGQELNFNIKLVSIA